ncbi:hypothetical protein CDD82_7049 [Ophiocordyceps australis]|uniref:Major facilitator superfamily (MFS) profile domain-containing protein n=1 Tax=Ophiocordyceps australis TaxID=1399860 RepID=A0A2C5YT89_9HYPO|nr:hypothetical protein CDD82_7049 [Ophiocordyceps australis]
MWAITWGILIQYFIQYGVAESIDGGPSDPAQSTAAFRIPWGVQAVPALVLLVALAFCPHSPRWLASQDRWDEALRVLADLHGGGDTTDARVRAQYREIEDALRYEREGEAGAVVARCSADDDDDGCRAAPGSGFSALLTRRMLKRVLLGMSIQAWSQLCGVNIMMYYVVYIMEGADIGSPLLTASIQYIINVVLTLPCIIFLDKWGRRPSLLVGSFLMMTWLFISGALQQYCGQPNTDQTRTKDNKDITWIVTGHRVASRAIVACAYLFVATFAATWGPTSWTYPAEIFPSRIRAKAVSISTATNWLFNMVLAFAVPPLLWHANYKTYYIFGCSALVHMFVAAHETKGYTLEEMDDVFDRGVRAWQPGKARQSRLDQIKTQIEREEKERGNMELHGGQGTKKTLPSVQELPSPPKGHIAWA